MHIIPIKTRIMQPPKDDLFSVLDESLPKLQEKDVLVVTSKVVAIHQGLAVRKGAVKNKKELIDHEADAIVPAEFSGIWNVTLTENVLLPAAGIDESNANGYYLTLPKNSSEFAHKIWNYIRKRDDIKELGVIITDSHSVPLRYGTVGVALGFFGFEPVQKHKGKKDLFGRPFTVSRTNIPDGLAVAAVFVMGETTECTPLCVVRDGPEIVFTERPTYDELIIPPEEDMYYPLIKRFFEKD